MLTSSISSISSRVILTLEGHPHIFAVETSACIAHSLLNHAIPPCGSQSGIIRITVRVLNKNQSQPFGIKSSRSALNMNTSSCPPLDDPRLTRTLRRDESLLSLANTYTRRRDGKILCCLNKYTRYVASKNKQRCARDNARALVCIIRSSA